MKTVIIGLTLLSTSVFAEDKVSGAPIAPEPLPPSIQKPRLPPNCLMYSKMVEYLSTKYGEHSLFQGIDETGRSMREIFVNAQKGSYTDIVITPRKAELIACIVGAGNSATINDAIKPHTI